MCIDVLKPEELSETALDEATGSGFDFLTVLQRTAGEELSGTVFGNRRELSLPGS